MRHCTYEDCKMNIYAFFSRMMHRLWRLYMFWTIRLEVAPRLLFSTCIVYLSQIYIACLGFKKKIRLMDVNTGSWRTPKNFLRGKPYYIMAFWFACAFFFFAYAIYRARELWVTVYDEVKVINKIPLRYILSCFTVDNLDIWVLDIIKLFLIFSRAL